MMRVATARRPRPFSVADQPNCAFALDLLRGVYSDSGGTSLATDGGAWQAVRESKTGILLTNTDADANTRPTWIRDSGFRGQPCLRFDNTKAQYATNAAWAAAYGATSWWWVCACNITAGTQPSPFGLQGDALTPRFESSQSVYYYSASRYANFGGYNNGPVLLVLPYDGAGATEALKLRNRVDGSERTATFGGGGSMGATSPAGAGIWIGRSAAGSNAAGMDLYGLWGFTGAPSASTIAAIEKSVGLSILARGTYQINVSGDSLSAAAFEGVLGEVHPEWAWPVLLQTRLGSRGVVNQHALSGSYMSQYDPDAIFGGGTQYNIGINVDARRNAWFDWDIDYCQGHVNMMRGAGAGTADQVMDRINGYVSLRKAANTHNARRAITVVATTPKASGGGVVEATRVETNNRIRAGLVVDADYIHDVDGLPELQNPNDQTYFAFDGLHLQRLGEQVWADHVHDVLLPLIARNGPPV